ncbi:MAG: hypothetical protein QME68_05805, partial [Elusimicrobiota bacterium]|nr:hypothetical protein [Elusimicrobiota bacterium]
MYKIKLLVFCPFLLLFLYKLCFCQKDTYPYLINAQSLNGYTGNIITPSPHTVEKNKFALGLHGFKVGLNYGIIPSGEVGVNFNLKELTASENFIQKISTTVAFHAKYNILNQYSKKHYFDFSVGIYRGVFYFVFGKRFENLFNTEIESGIETSFVKET